MGIWKLTREVVESGDTFFAIKGQILPSKVGKVTEEGFTFHSKNTGGSQRFVGPTNGFLVKKGIAGVFVGEEILAILEELEGK